MSSLPPSAEPPPAQPGLPEAEVLDHSILRGLRALEARAGKALLPEMAEMFEGYAARYCGRIRQALRTRDAAALRMGSHKLKGSSRALGLARLSVTCARLEAMAVDVVWEQAEQEVSLIEGETARAMAALRDYLGVSKG
ncbi:MAG: Hpt domain-containing protein [Acidobacteriota bacterium]